MSVTDVRSDFNRQLNQELRNAYFYFSMSAFFDHLSLAGFAHFFRAQAKEELGHATKFYEFIVNRGWGVELQEIPKPKAEWSSILEAIQDFLKAEEENTKRIWQMVDLARQAGDKAAESFLQWFVNEQVEEEKTAGELLARLKLVKDQPAGLLVLDKELSERR